MPGIGRAELATYWNVAGIEQAARCARPRQREHHAMADAGLPP